MKLRDGLVFHLKEKGIGTSIHYATPVPLMSYYKEKYGHTKKDFPNATRYGENVISLPIHKGLTGKDIEYVCNIIIDFLNKYK